MGDLGTNELERALAGHTASLEALIARLTPVVQARVARVLLRQVRRRATLRQDVEDFSQDVLMLLFSDEARILRSWQSERGLTLEQFAGMVTERRTISILRSGRRNPWREEPTEPDDLDSVSDQAGPEVSTASKERLGQLLDRVREAVSPQGWQLFRLLFVEERSVQETMLETGLSSDAVYAWRSRLRRLARRQLVELDASTPTAGKAVPHA